MSRLLLVVMLLLVPLAGLFASLHVGVALQFAWEGLLGEAGEMLGDEAPTLAHMCALDGRLDGTLLCQRQAAAEQLQFMSLAALAGAAGLPLVMLAWGALVRVWRAPLLLFGLVAKSLPPLLLSLLLLEGAVLTLGLVLVETALLGRDAPVAGVLGGLLAGALLLACTGPSLRLNSVPPRFVLAHIAESERHPRLRELVRELAGRVDAEAPETLLLGLEPGVYVSGERLFVYPAERLVAGPVLYVSVALLRVLSEAEFSALLAHELSHLEVRQRRGTLRAWPAMAGLERRLQLRSGGWRRFFEWPAASLLALLLELALAAAWRHELLRERHADSAGADVSSATAMGRALLRLTAAQREWRDQDRDLLRAIAEERRAMNLSRVFYRRLQLLSARPWLDELGRERVTHPVDEHPPLLERLDALGLGRADFSNNRLLTADEPAFALLDDGERLEVSLSDAQYLLYRARGYAQPASP